MTTNMRKRTIILSALALFAGITIFFLLFRVSPVFIDLFNEQGKEPPAYTAFVTSGWVMTLLLLGYIAICIMAFVIFKKSWPFFWGFLLSGELIIITTIIIGMYLPMFIYSI